MADKGKSRFSQFKEEEIIQTLWRGKQAGRCADIGARRRQGSNTALLFDQGWFCQFIDKDPDDLLISFPVPHGVRTITPWGVVYRGNANHELVGATVTPDNVNDILAKDLDLLSIDIDGNDYYVWEAVEQTPSIVIIEINPRTAGLQKLNQEGIYQGCSEGHMLALGARKGYKFHARTGVNLIFVR